MVRVALELGSHSSRYARQQCSLWYCRVCKGWCVLNVILSLLLGNGLLSKDQVAKLGLAICVGSGCGFGQKETEAMGYAVE